MKRLKSAFTALLILGIFALPLSGQTGDDQPDRRSKKRGFFSRTRYLGINNTYEDDLKGLQIGAVSNMVYGDLTGLQMAGLANVAEGDMGGFQVAGLANITGRTATGGQLSMLANISGNDAGIQLTGLTNLAGGGAKFQAAGLANVSGGGFTWGQFSGLANISAGGSGIQISGLANVTGGDRASIQIAGLANVNEGIALIQTAGLVNVSGESVWAQIGLINISPKARLVQIGLLNVAGENSGLPLGVINIIADYPLRLSVTIDGYGQAITALRSGNKHIYTVAGFQGGRDISLERLGDLLLGVGLNLPMNRAYLSVEYLHNQRINAWDKRAGTVGLRAGFRMTTKLALVAGASLRVNDLTSGNAASGITQGWNIGLEWFKLRNFDAVDWENGLKFQVPAAG